MAAPAALPVSRLAERLQKMGSAAMMPMAARENPDSATESEGMRPTAAKPDPATRKSSGSERKPRLRLAASMASAPTPKVSVAHQPVESGEAPRATRILGRKKI